jgi:hypothetical protein
MPDRSKGGDQTKCSPWSSRLEVGHGAINSTLEKCSATKPPEPMEKDHGEGQDLNRAASIGNKQCYQTGCHKCLQGLTWRMEELLLFSKVNLIEIVFMPYYRY